MAQHTPSQSDDHISMELEDSTTDDTGAQSAAAAAAAALVALPQAAAAAAVASSQSTANMKAWVPLGTALSHAV